MNFTWKMITLGVGAVAGMAAKGLVDVVWEKGLGKRKPTGDDDDLDQSFLEVAVFTAVTATVTAVTTEAVRRRTQKVYGKRVAKKGDQAKARTYGKAS